MFNIPPEVKDATPSVLGAALSFFLGDRGLRLGAILFFGGCTISILGTAYVADLLGMTRYPGLVGFLLGTFGGLFLAKTYDTFSQLNLTLLVNEILDILKARLGNRFKGGSDDHE